MIYKAAYLLGGLIMFALGVLIFVNSNGDWNAIPWGIFACLAGTFFFLLGLVR